MTKQAIERTARHWVDRWIARGGNVRDMDAPGFLAVVRELQGVPFTADTEAALTCALVYMAELRATEQQG